jgi:hypothetical protein
MNMRFRFYESRLFSKPIFFVLLPVFFVLHGFSENLFLINFKDMLLLMLFYIAVEACLFFIFVRIYKNSYKSALAVFLTFGIYFFFGAFHDLIKSLLNNFLSSYTFLLILLTLLYLFCLIYLKHRGFIERLAVYLNFLFLLLIFTDIGIIIFKVNNYDNIEFSISKTSTINKPNIYLIVVDEYAGQDQLKSTFNYENHLFLNGLSALNFSVINNSRSNYNATPFSIASLMSMSFHNELSNFIYTDENLKYCYTKISRSNVVSGLKSVGYQFFNYSIFDIEGEKSVISKTFLKSGTQLITSQTLWNRVKRDLYENFVFRYMRKTSLYKKLIMQDYYSNELLYDRTTAQAIKLSGIPKFVYTHLLMPHFPYYFNSDGKLNSIEKLGPENLNNKTLYLGYLQYANNKILDLLNKLISGDKNAIILLLSDHGYRYANDGNMIYSNLLAIYDKQHYIRDIESLHSNVNVFRLLFNSLFKTNLKLLPDKKFK